MGNVNLSGWVAGRLSEVIRICLSHCLRSGHGVNTRYSDTKHDPAPLRQRTGSGDSLSQSLGDRPRGHDKVKRYGNFCLKSIHLEFRLSWLLLVSLSLVIGCGQVSLFQDNPEKTGTGRSLSVCALLSSEPRKIPSPSAKQPIPGVSVIFLG